MNRILAMLLSIALMLSCMVMPAVAETADADIVVIGAGGAGLSAAIEAVENGADAGFGRGTKGIHDATFLVKRRRELEAAGKWPR